MRTRPADGVTRDQVVAWLAAYERAWRSPGTAALSGLFSQDAIYRQGPYEDVLAGLPEIARDVGSRARGTR